MNFLSIIAILILTSCMIACTEEKKDDRLSYPAYDFTYPPTTKGEVVDDYFGTEVADPYRWLEVDTAAEVEAWVDAQNEVTFDYLHHIPFRSEIRDRCEELYNYTKYSVPRQVGNQLIFYKNDGLQNQPVIYIMDRGDDPTNADVLLDPNAWSESGTSAISLIGASRDNQYMAFLVQEAGSDWGTIHVMNLENGEVLEDKLEWVKFSGASWHGNGFFYSRYPAPDEGMELSNENSFHSVYYHTLGQDQAQDELIYRDDKAPKMYHNVAVTEDNRFLIMEKASGTDGFETWFMSLYADKSDFEPLFTGFTNKNSVVDHRDGYFYVLTDVDAPNYRLVRVPADDPDIRNWEDVLPEQDYLLESVRSTGGKLFANYLQNATNQIYVYDFDGNEERKLDLPGTGSVGGFGGKSEATETYYSYTSFIYPSTIFRYDIESGTSEVMFASDLDFDPAEYLEKQVWYPSKDGTEVSMFIVHRKDVELDGQNPTLLYGYGGFNISLGPSFSSSRLVLLEKGGVYAMPNLRGGGEYGEEWHQQGMLEKKQNVFDDFIAAAEYLIDEGYTNSKKLAISGRSNGGLLVGACMTQRPELFQVAFPGVGVLDMLRFHKFTIGWGWVPEYGSSDDPEQFKFLYAYSPYHNLEEGTAYPATLVTTADHDDRVVPAHSFKFAARLQEVQAGPAPVLIRIDKDAGHGAGKPTSKILDEQADVWSFLFYNMDERY
ncbi:prolyl oligopeptidase family serine peptidase [Membranicola marinus]|uniref:prolyl oligopeptidase n=1 Tax=Membranihabitans marinus TaxID=1227546 RepID=A0A953I1Q9_9BACT|nr:prolyl oligopeptidase family serine peptidase [Membranihabitans marinus]MBY5959687.1 prolyl oligopeptidase family serine peptidase [Membranihabitans marinus]